MPEFRWSQAWQGIKRVATARFSATGITWADLETPSLWWPGVFFTRKSETGESVDAQKALTVDAWFAGIRNFSEDLAKTPCLIMKGSQDAKGRITAKEAKKHPLYEILGLRYNPEMSAMNGKECQNHLALGWGGGGAEIVRDGFGTIKELWPIHTTRIQIKRDKNMKLYYQVWVSPAEKNPTKIYDLPAEDMLWIHGLGSTGISGYVLSALATEAIGAGLAEERFVCQFFKNDLSFGTVITEGSAKEAKQLEAMRRYYITQFSGEKHSPITLAKDSKIERLGIPQADAWLIDLQKITIEKFCRWLRIPKHIVGLTGDQYAREVAQEFTEYNLLSLMPWFVRIEQEMNYKLLTPDERKQGYFIWHDVESNLRGDLKSQADYWKARFESGNATPNEARLAFKDSPIEEDGADQLWTQSGMKPMSEQTKPPKPMLPPGFGGIPKPGQPGQPPVQPGQQPPAPPDKQTARAIFEPLIEDALRRVFGKEAKALAKGNADFEKFYGETGQIDYYADSLGIIFAAYYRAKYSYSMAPLKLWAERCANEHKQAALSGVSFDLDAEVKKETARLLAELEVENDTGY